MKIILNGKLVTVDRETLSFDDFRQLAGMPFADTVTYHNGAAPETGTLTHGEYVTVKDGTIVNVAMTSGS